MPVTTKPRLSFIFLNIIYHYNSYYHLTLCDQYFADNLDVGLPCALCLA
jgi:hypothetical protein